jgi:hypothetical protein
MPNVSTHLRPNVLRAVFNNQSNMCMAGTRPATATSKIERVDPPIGADIEVILRCYQRLEVAQPAHRPAGTTRTWGNITE